MRNFSITFNSSNRGWTDKFILCFNVSNQDDPRTDDFHSNEPSLDFTNSGSIRPLLAKKGPTHPLHEKYTISCFRDEDYEFE